MKKLHKVLLTSGVCLLAFGVVVAVVGPPLYRDFIAPPAAEAPTITGDPSLAEGLEDTAESGPLSLEEISGTWDITDGSTAGYRVNEVLNGTDVTVTGRTSEVTGSLTISADGRTLEAAEFTVDVASIETDRSQRDAYFREQAINVAEYPEASFALTEPVTVETVPDAGEVVTVDATGELTIAGVTKQVTVSIEVRSDGSTTELAGSIPVTFSDFGVRAPSLGFVKVEDHGFVEFQLTAAKS
ncbi:MAG: YceI family protein [Leucobacter sp.]